MKYVSSFNLMKISLRRHSYITTPIFYANASPHLGHLYTSVLGDAAHRWQKLKDPTGRHVFSVGTDEHGSKILRSAEAAGKEPQQFCDEVSSRFGNLFNEFDIKYTHFIRTTEPHHKTAVQHMWSKLKEAGYIYKDVYGGWYSVVDECFYPDKDVEETELDGNKVKVVKGTKTVVEWVEEENYMFKLSEFREKVRHWLVNNDVIRPRHYLPLVLRCLEVDDSLSVSRCRKRLPWGIPVPDDDSQTIYVWLDALVNYASVVGYPVADMDREHSNWPPTWQIIGKDIMKFHAFYWPAFLLGAGLPLPEKLFIHGHWLVENSKMSKSVGNVVDPLEIKDVFTSDGLRYFLLKQGVPHDDSNYTHLKALQVVNSDLVNNIGNLLSRGTVEKLNPSQKYPYFDTVVMDEEINANAAPLISQLNEISEKTGHLYDQLMFYKAIEGIMALVKQGNALFQLHEPWKMKQGPKLSTVLYLSYETVRIASVLLQPVVPQYSAFALDRLGVAPDKRGLSTAKLGDGKGFHIAGGALGEDKGPFIRRLKEDK